MAVIDWQEKVPALAVAAWIGHDVKIAAKHYYAPSEGADCAGGEKKTKQGGWTMSKELDAMVAEGDGLYMVVGVRKVSP